MRLDILGRPIRRKKRTCVNGHAMTPDNTKLRTYERLSKTTGAVLTYQFHECQECQRGWSRLAKRRARGNVMMEGRV